MPAKRIRHSKPKTSSATAPMVSAAIKGKPSKLGTGLENEGFVIDLFLDKQKQVQLTQVLHVKSNEGEEWEGWNPKRLVDFFLERAQLAIPEHAIEQIEELENMISPGLAAPKNDTEGTGLPALTAAGIETKQAESALTGSTLPAIALEIAQPIARAVEVVSAYTKQAERSLARREPFEVLISLEKTSLHADEKSEFDYRLLVSAHKRGQNSKYFIAANRGLIKATDQSIQVHIPRQNLEPGAYCLRAEIAIMTQPQPGEGIPPQLVSSLKLQSRLFQII